jgi:hypothetical protein
MISQWVNTFMNGGLSSAFSLFSGATLSPLVTFTRASSATYVDSAGVIQTSTTNTPRIDYDPATLAFKGLLVEEARTNSYTYSSQFDNAAWTKSGALVTANAITGPDGTASADLLAPLTSAGNKAVQQNLTTTTHTQAFYVKSGGYNYPALRQRSAAGQVVVTVFDLTNGTVSQTTNQGTTFSAVSSSITDAGDGFYRISMTATRTSGSTNCVLDIVETATPSLDTNGIMSWSGDGTSGIYIWGADMQAGAFLTSHIPTVAATATRAVDVASVTGTNFSDWYNTSEGVAYVEVTPKSISSGFVLSFEGATTANTADLRFGSGLIDAVVVAASAVQVDAAGFAITAGQTAKVALALKTNDFAFTKDGGTVQVDAAGTLPTLDRLYLGSRSLGNSFTGHIKRFRYYDTRLTDATLVGLTT